MYESNNKPVNTAEKFKKEIAELGGKECWGVVGGSGTGSVINLKVEDRFLKKAPSKSSYLSDLVRNYDSEYDFMIYCPWRIENDGEVICGSHHTNEDDGPYKRGFDQLIGEKIYNVSSSYPAFDLEISFGNGVILNASCVSIGMDDNICYSFRTPKGWFTIYFDGDIEFEQHT